MVYLNIRPISREVNSTIRLTLRALVSHKAILEGVGTLGNYSQAIGTTLRSTLKGLDWFWNNLKVDSQRIRLVLKSTQVTR